MLHFDKEVCKRRVRAIQALLDGMSVSQISQAYQLNRTTLYRWRIRYERADDPRIQVLRHAILDATINPNSANEAELREMTRLIGQKSAKGQ